MGSSLAANRRLEVAALAAQVCPDLYYVEEALGH